MSRAQIRVLIETCSKEELIEHIFHMEETIYKDIELLEAIAQIVMDKAPDTVWFTEYETVVEAIEARIGIDPDKAG